MSEEKPIDPSVVVLQSVLTKTAQRGGREVRFGPEGIVYVDAMGKVDRLLVDGLPYIPDVAAIRGIFDAPHWITDVWERGDGAGTKDIHGHGEWRVGGEGDVLTLKPKKVPSPILDFVFESRPDDLAVLRAAYVHGGCDIVMLVEGETRAREAAAAIGIERRLAGLPGDSRFERHPMDRRYWNSRRPDRDLSGTDMFDLDPVKGAKWNINWLRRGNEVRYGEKDMTRDFLSENREDPDTEVFVGVSNGWMDRSLVDFVAKEERSRPLAIVQVEIVKSKPVAKMLFSESMRELVAGSVVDPEAPWTVIAAKRAARSAARPKVPRTWHQTTQAVADAFVERQAPRGLLSGKTLFFHGPVIYAVYSGNPIGAIVDAPDGGMPLLFVGRDEGIGGSTAGTVTSAQYDVERAARDKFRVIDVGPLDEFLTVGGIKPGDFSGRVSYNKSESQHPSTCTIDGPLLAAWLTRKLAAANVELDRIQKKNTKAATYVGASVYATLERLSLMRDQLQAFVDVELPSMPDAAEMGTIARKIGREAEIRQIKLAQKRRVRGMVERISKEDEAAEEQRDDPFAM